jgi:hypothetical protein
MLSNTTHAAYIPSDLPRSLWWLLACCMMSFYPECCFSLQVLDSTFASTAKLFGPEFIGLITTGRPLPPSAAKPVSRGADSEEMLLCL